MQKLWVVTLVTLAGLAGCLDDGTDAGSDDGLEEQTIPMASGLVPVAPGEDAFLGTIDNDHLTGAVGHAGHQIAELHDHASGLMLLDHDSLAEGLEGTGSGFTEVHVSGDLAVVSSVLGNRGLTLVDISDPTDLKVLSHIYNYDDNWDARISPDGQYVFMGCQGSTVVDCLGEDNSGEQPGFIGDGACASIAPEPAGCPGGIAVYDISDPTAPEFKDYLHMGFTHNVFVYQHDSGPYEGKYYVMNAAGAVAQWDPETGLFEQASQNITASHDIAVQKHPLTGEWLLYTGIGGSTMSIWNVDDPFEPKLIGSVAETHEGEPVPLMWHEQTPMPCLIDGRHITIGAGERGSGEPEPVGIVDTTDPTNPIYLGAWQLPDFDALTGQQTYRFSLHNIDGNCDGQVAVGHYHAGVWVFDISTYERMLEPATLGYYMPHERPVDNAWSPVTGAPIGGMVTADVPNVWAAQWSADGKTLFIPDMSTGLYALAPTWEYENDA